MKKLIFTILGVLILCGLFAQDIPHKISYQGKLLENGYPVNGTKSITFTIGSWSETHSSVQITDGLYSVTLGETTAIPTSIFDNSTSVKLQISVAGTNLTPNTDILSVPYAYKAEKAVDAEKLNGQNPTFYNNWDNLNNIPSDIADGDDVDDADNNSSNELQSLSLSGNDLTISNGNTVTLPSGSSVWTQSGSNIYYNNGNVGIGSNVNSPQFPLHVVDNQTSLKIGVGHFQNQSTNVDAAGVSGWCDNTDYYGYGVRGVGGYAGVSGFVSSPTGTNDYIGVVGLAENSGGGATLYGVYGKENGGNANSYGVFSFGNLGATGTKSFVIDHPLDPTNKYLKHFCVESPEVLNIYRGTIILDDQGEAIVSLPAYFIEINVNFSYHLTPIGHPSLVYVKEKVNNNNEFVIAGGEPGMEVSWIIFCERNDLYIQQNPDAKKAEVEKTEHQKGKYTMPRLYGKPDEMGIFYKIGK